MDAASCHPQQPVSVLEIHGTADLELLYGGGGIGGLGKPLPTIPDMMATWAALDGCLSTPVTLGGGTVQVTTWTPCSGDTSVVLDTVEGGSHNWYAPQLEGADAALDATRAVWQFLSAKHR